MKISKTIFLETAVAITIYRLYNLYVYWKKIFVTGLILWQNHVLKTIFLKTFVTSVNYQFNETYRILWILGTKDLDLLSLSKTDVSFNLKVRKSFSAKWCFQLWSSSKRVTGFQPHDANASSCSHWSPLRGGNFHSDSLSRRNFRYIFEILIQFHTIGWKKAQL